MWHCEGHKSLKLQQWTNHADLKWNINITELNTVHLSSYVTKCKLLTNSLIMLWHFSGLLHTFT